MFHTEKHVKIKTIKSKDGERVHCGAIFHKENVSEMHNRLFLSGDIQVTPLYQSQDLPYFIEDEKYARTVLFVLDGNHVSTFRKCSPCQGHITNGMIQSRS